MQSFDRIRNMLRVALVAIAALGAVALTTLAERAVTQPPLAAIVTVLVVAGALARYRLNRYLPRRVVLEIDLERTVVEQVPTDPLGGLMAAEAHTLRDIVDVLRRAAGDRRVTQLLARVGPSAPGLAQCQELRDAVAEFRAAGKRTVAFAETFGDERAALVGYYLATAFEEIHLLPSGDLTTVGLLRRKPFVRGLLDRLGVVPNVGRRREYKSAADLITETKMSDAHREADTALLDAHFDQIVSGIAAGRSLDAAAVRDLIDRGPLLAPEALEAGLVDRLSYRDQVYDAAKEAGTLTTAAKYLTRAGRPDRKGERVALIYGVGLVVRKRGALNPIQPGSALSSDAVGEALRGAVKDKKVKAIVLRIDSPGGSAVASEVIWRELQRAREAGKPVVASLGNVAASGGYYIAAAADKIVAQPGTVTGSIGVVSGKLVAADAWAKIGVGWDEVHAGEHAAMWSADRPFTDAEWRRFDAGLDAVYDTFKERVAAGRGMSTDEVEEVARGRVWAGATAQRLELVDELGGLARAVELAAAAVGAAKVRVEQYPRAPRASLLSRLPGSPKVSYAPAARHAAEALATASRAVAAAGGVPPGNELLYLGEPG